jgi:hypothetical protein
VHPRQGFGPKKPNGLSGSAAEAGKEAAMDIKVSGLRIKARFDYRIVLAILSIALVLLLKK